MSTPTPFALDDIVQAKKGKNTGKITKLGKPKGPQRHQVMVDKWGRKTDAWVHKSKIIKVQPPFDLEQALAEIIGLGPVKEEIRALKDTIEHKLDLRRRNLPNVGEVKKRPH